MFWGLILKSNKKYTQTLEKSFHLSKASLDISTTDNEPVQVMYTHDNNSYLLCTLQKGKFLDCSLDLNFQEGDNLCFSTKGNGIVHLTGYLIPDDDDFGDFEDAMDDESIDEEAISDLREKLDAGKKKKDPKASKKQVPVEESEEEEDDDSDAELDQTAENDEESGEEEEDDEEEEDEDEEEDSDEEQVVAPPAKQQKLDPHAKQNGKKQNGLENGGKKEDKKDKKQKQKEKGQEGKIQKLQGGLLVQDLKVGTGAEAKPGKKVQVYYEGRLKTNNKVFDATKTGPGFKFSLGKGEVIKGWDLGIAGLKVGGKRRLICPPQLAYGAKGNLPVIPQNSTLVFDVELKNVF